MTYKGLSRVDLYNVTMKIVQISKIACGNIIITKWVGGICISKLFCSLQLCIILLDMSIRLH